MHEASTFLHQPAILKSVSGFSNTCNLFFTEMEHQPIAQLPVWRARHYNSSGLSPKACPAWLNPPGTKVSTVITSRVIKASRPPHHVKALSTLMSKGGGFFYITLLYCFNFSCPEKQKTSLKKTADPDIMYY